MLILLGLCPVALGTDGGGSVRIPAAACGVVGIKGTCRYILTTVFIPAQKMKYQKMLHYLPILDGE